MEEPKEMNFKEWNQEGERRFGKDKKKDKEVKNEM